MVRIGNYFHKLFWALILGWIYEWQLENLLCSLGCSFNKSILYSNYVTMVPSHGSTISHDFLQICHSNWVPTKLAMQNHVVGVWNILKCIFSLWGCLFVVSKTYSYIVHLYNTLKALHYYILLLATNWWKNKSNSLCQY